MILDILFRAKHRYSTHNESDESSAYVTGYYMEKHDMPMIHSELYGDILIKKDTLQMWTGAVDKNDNKIFFPIYGTNLQFITTVNQGV